MVMGSKPAGLWVPTSGQIHNKPRTLLCTICPAEFYDHEMAAYLKHCSTAHGPEDLKEHSLAMQAPALFGEAGGDEEWGAWVAKHRAIDPEGREWHRWGKTEGGKSGGGLGDG